jgi:recombination protein RecT
MAKPSEVSTAIQSVHAAPMQSIQSLIEQSSKELGRALPDGMKPERLVRIALTCIRTTPELGNCTPVSFLGALFTSAQLGIEPVAGQAYLLPFNNSRKINNKWIKVKEVQFILGYKGVFSLFYRHEKAIAIKWAIVKEHDDFDYEYGTQEFLRHKEAKADRGKTVGFWVLAELRNGGKIFKYMSVDECMEHGRKHSKTFDKEANAFNEKSPWVTEPDSMCLKTVSVQLAKTLPLSIEVQRALGADESSREYRKEIDSALDLPDTTNWAESEVVEDESKAEEKKETKATDNHDSKPTNEAFQMSVNALKAKLTKEEYKGVLLEFKVENEIELVNGKRNLFLIQLGKRIALKEENAKNGGDI